MILDRFDEIREIPFKDKSLSCHLSAYISNVLRHVQNCETDQSSLYSIDLSLNRSLIPLTLSLISLSNS